MTSDIEKTRTSALDQMFRPRSIAIVGASAKPGTARNRIVQILMKHGYAGRVYPVAISDTEVEGMATFRTVADLPEVPDVALVITPAATVPDIIDQCGEKGIRCVMVFSAGFEEIEAGKDHARRLREAAERHGIQVLGPNGQGAWSVAASAMMTFSAAAYDLAVIRHAPIAIVSQSGALSGAIGNYLQTNGLGCSYIISVGNETCLDALDVLAWVIEQEDVRVVALYLEGLDQASRLIELARKARARGIQIVALKAGRSAVGQDATASHTGKIASPYAIYVDVLEQAGVIVARSLAETMAALEVLCFLPNPRVSGDALGGVSVLSSSGGAGALLADHSEDYGVPMAVFGDATAALLERTLPEFARKANPIDLTGQIRGNPGLFPDTLAVLLNDKRTEAVIIQFASSGMSGLLANGDAFKTAAQTGGLPVIVSFAAGRADPAVKSEFLDAGVLITEDPAKAMQALRWLYDRARWSRDAVPDESDQPRAYRSAPSSWTETMAFLDDCGIPAATWTVLAAGDVAATACAALHYPLVVKALPSEAEHKTELGLVHLRVQAAEAVDVIAATMRTALGKPEMGVLVQEMITDGIEVVLACLRDTDFGPVLSIGSGGTAVELYRDVTYLALPVTPAEVDAALRKLKLWTLLSGFRGAPRADIPALVDATVRFGNVMLATPDLREAEINPVLVRPAGLGLAAVDFLGTIAPR